MNKKINKRSFMSNVIFSITFCFTLFFFSPIDIYLSSQHDFLLGYTHFFVPLFALALVSSITLILFLSLFNAINRTFFEVVLCLFFGLLLSAYIQMLFMNSRMSLITGDATSYTEYNFFNISNLLIYEIIIFIPLFFWYAKKQYPKVKFLNAGKGYLIVYLSALMFFMQLSGTLGLAAQNGLGKDNKSDFIRYLSYEPLMSLSSDKNITVFITDRMDGEWMDQTLERYPDLYDELDGFTYYRDNVSCYSNTFPSIVNMLTHMEPEKDEHLRKFLNRAWAQQSVPSKFKDNGWKTNLSISYISTYSGYNNIEGVCDNLLPADVDYKINYWGDTGIIKTMINLSLSKLTPYFFKDFFTAGYLADFSNDFVYTSNTLPDMIPKSTGIESDIAFYDYLTEHKLNKNSDKPVFSFIHLNGAHDVSDKLSGLYNDTSAKEADEMSTARGDFVIICEYLEQLKKLGLYDNTAVIIVGDHGRPANDDDSTPEAITTTLMIKPYSSPSAKLKTDSEHEMSNCCISASLLEYAGITHDEYGITFSDVINKDIHWTRYFSKFHMGNFVNKYSIDGNSRNVSNWKLVE